ncbi:Serine_hydroxymethyltransferase [Hexamita inflata]|uniref:glycine hydroxymethyltransferase n=1 Tax=Hexamita inflata TaxID=28002 RepID=A0AA86NG95_9EUKA|nr:Serine hydroxymethyltransferase [Hexamita inflata]
MDPVLQQLLDAEHQKQVSTINLIASENFATETTLRPLSSCLSNKYAEGEPGDRCYPGVEIIDKIELLAMQRLKQLYNLSDEWIINVQPLSGAPANLELLTALFPLQSKVMMLTHDHGGHMSHGDAGSLISKLFKVSQYYLGSNALLDYEHIKQRLSEEKPDVLIAGFSCYPRDIDYKTLKQLCTEANCHFHVDMAHIAGLVAAKLMSSPFIYADSVTTTTHKTLRGPRGGVIFSKTKCHSGVFPGVQAGPHMATVASVAQAAFEAQQDSFKSYCAKTIQFSKLSGEWFVKNGFNVQTGGTDSHMILVETVIGAEELLGAEGIYVNGVHMVNGKHGVRMGWACMASFGVGEAEVMLVCEAVKRVLNGERGQEIQKIVQEVTKKFKY